MSNPQRNNVARLPWDARERVCQMLFDGATHAEVRAAVRAMFPAGSPTLHDSSLSAYRRSAEYREYCDHRKQWDASTGKNRLIAAAINDGRGPESAADVMVYQALQALAAVTPETVGDAARLANAAAALKRVVIAQRDADYASKIDELRKIKDGQIECLHADCVAKDMEIARLRAEIERVRRAAAGAGVDVDADPAHRGEGLSAAALKQIEEKAKLL